MEFNATITGNIQKPNTKIYFYGPTYISCPQLNWMRTIYFNSPLRAKKLYELALK